MPDASTDVPLDPGEQTVHLRRAREESEAFLAERKNLMTEAPEPERDRMPVPWQLALFGMTAGAAFFAAGTAFAKLLGR